MGLLRLRTFLRAERGFALLLALASLTVLGVSVTTVVAYTSQNQHSANYSNSKQSSYDLAEAGINAAMAVLSNSSQTNPMDPSALPSTTITFDTGTATYSGSLNTAPTGAPANNPNNYPIWTITSTGSVRNPFGNQNATRTMTAQAVVNPSPYFQTETNHAWDYIYSSATGTAGGCDQNVWNTFGAPLYVAGKLCITNNATNATTGVINSGPILVQDTTYLKNSGNKVQASGGGNISGTFSSRNGCQYMANTLHNPCVGSSSHTDNVWATTNSNPLVLPPPTADYDWAYTAAAPGPNVPCNASKSSSPSSNWPTFDNDSDRNNSLSAVVDLTPGYSYDCYAGNGQSGNAAGELKWDNTNKKLYIIGTVYIDGSAKITNAVVNTYTGWGALYLSGTFLMQNSKMCGGGIGGWWGDPTCTFANNAYQAFAQILLIVADGNGGQGGAVPNGDSIKLTASAFEGWLYGTNAIEIDKNSNFQGPMVAPTEKIDTVVKPWTGTWFVPTGTPGNPQTSKTTVQPPSNYSG